MNDYLVRGMSMDGFVKVVAIRSTQIVREAARIHKTTPNATAAFGRALTAASMMGNMQKTENGSMTMQIKGGGPIGTIVCVSDSVGNVRGYVYEPNLPLIEKYPGKLDVGAVVGTDGTLTVIRDLQMKEPYVGSVPLVSGEIGDDVTAYFAQSEQTPTACALGVLVDRDQSVKVAGGYLLQLLPGAPDEVIDKLEAGIRRAGAVTAMLDAGLTPEEILGQVCGDTGDVAASVDGDDGIAIGLEGQGEQGAFRGGFRVGEGHDGLVILEAVGPCEVLGVRPGITGFNLGVRQLLVVEGQDQLAVCDGLGYGRKDPDRNRGARHGCIQHDRGLIFHSHGADAQSVDKQQGAQQENEPVSCVFHRFTSLG